LLKYKKVLQVRKTLENRLGQNQVTDKEVWTAFKYMQW
jgi:hypothetical protein